MHTMAHTTAKPSLGIITIATGKYYEQFIPNLKASVDAFFPTDALDITFYCFTDQVGSVEKVEHFPLKHLSWPFSTLLRYHWISQHLTQLSRHDFVLYLDADMQVVSPIDAGLFNANLLAVKHPGFVAAPGAFELDRTARTYVPPPLRKTYYQGCVWGGARESFARLITELNGLVAADLAQGLIPLWHDESYLNWYLASHPCTALPPNFAWPQGQAIEADLPPVILHLEKPHQQIRQMDQAPLEVIAILQGDNTADQLRLYQQLYLEAHEKTQRLEARLAKPHWSWERLRESLAYYKARWQNKSAR